MEADAWIAPFAETSFIVAGIYYVNLVTQVYLADAFTIYAASAASAESCLRSVFGLFYRSPGRRCMRGWGQGGGIRCWRFWRRLLCRVRFH